MRATASARQVAVVTLLWALAVGCTNRGADHQLLDRFFAASRLRDRTALAGLSTVVFEPHRDGIVVSFAILASASVNADQRDLTVRAVVRDVGGAESSRVLSVRVARRPAAAGAASRWLVTGFR